MYKRQETYSPEDIKSTGAYKYIESGDFQLLMVSFAFDTSQMCIRDRPSKYAEEGTLAHEMAEFYLRARFRITPVDVTSAEFRKLKMSDRYSEARSEEHTSELQS